MMNEFRRSSSRFAYRLSLFGAVVSIALCASAAAQAPETPFQKAMEKIDLGVSGLGQITPSNSGTNYLKQTVSAVPSNTLGALVELRYTRSPLIGVEFNYSYSRYNNTFSVSGGSLPAQPPYQIGVQSKVNEYSLGYVGHGPTFFGLKSFGGAGVGAIEFKPTTGGGQSVMPEVRTGFYYTVGVEQGFNDDKFGVRAYFRQLFFGAVDFNENYLATGARSITTEPGVGFYLRF
jgi:opacity protein-like surface antigen